MVVEKKLINRRFEFFTLALLEMLEYRNCSALVLFSRKTEHNILEDSNLHTIARGTKLITKNETSDIYIYM